MRISTWNKDSHGLYDYESAQDNYKNDTYYIDATTLIYRDQISILFIILDSITALQTKSDARAMRDSFAQIATISIDRKENKSTYKF